MNAPARRLDEVLRAVADGNRRAILDVVRTRPTAVGEIAEQLALSQQTVSHHLRVLRTAQLIAEQRQGTRHLFVVRPDGFEVAHDFIERFWATKLVALKRAAETAAENAAEATTEATANG